MERTIFTQEHDEFRSMLRDFIDREVLPHQAEWDALGRPPREFFHRLGELGVLGIQVPEEFGGGGESSFKYNAIVFEEVARAGVSFGSYTVHSCLILPYLLEYGSDEQRKRWLPDFASGRMMTAIAMTEPGTGSDLANIATTAKLSADGSHYVVNGAKTFITGGVTADLVLTVCRTAPFDPEDRRAGLSILCVPTDAEGFSVGRKLDKIGLHQQDTAELSYQDVRVPVENLLGEEGKAFGYLAHNLPQERLSIALNQVGQAAAAIEHAVAYTKDRKVFGKPVASFQNTKFVLAECSAEVQAARVFADHCLELLDRGELSVADAARAKLYCTEVAGRVIDKCLQLHGGYGYITEYPIARLYADTRVSRIYGGTSEVMKTIIAKDLGL
ncbi:MULTISPECIES: acyl-CoA dehydrogenase family protein [Rhodococcus]|uniref:Acyl-CoA dehydrogenase family protein n=1 Tax=Rhodococcus aetherivorans TaxID=191292 RepID=A0A059MIA7_9NOCA|nr:MULTISPECIES: acyl-CoA dehydrogenase family protein [Rhodococcus]NCL75076.1 Acyl-CoA dehydrogenase [Rhodococcus sp. YH1]OOL32239.1 acyl-CoA dehydrogenase [Rhodococcus rhodochrous]AKE91618.1 acyl-CoA dehydrogenase [Rhodococcus aetherivorans]ANZ23545.1 acyl-CoA dehydrogenase [Rhodococcus sp. WB1]KDE10666.1 acyl-CoA dehydrogenase [Rhodococcus aetherivorans]